MKLDFFPGGSWQNFNDQMAESLFVFDANYQLKTYLGLQHGLIEVTQGLLKLFPHKNKIYFFKDLDPAFEHPIKQLAKDGHEVNPIDESILQSVDSFIEGLDRETLFLLYPMDDPLLGKVFNTGPLVEALSEKRIFSIGVSHSAHRWNALPKQLNKFAIQLYAISPSACMALLGDRAKIGDIVAESLCWNDQLATDFNEYVSQLKSQEAANFREQIECFEAKLGNDAHIIFDQGAPRVCDRAVFCWDDMDGFAFVSALSQELNLAVQPPGQNPMLETASLIRWGGVKTMDWLQQYGLSENQIRGLVIIDHSLLSDELIKKISKVRQQILNIQFGT